MSDLFQSDRNLPAWFFYMNTTPDRVRCWTGARNFRLPPDLADPEGGVYLGMGRVIKVPSLTLPINGAFVQHQFLFAGVAEEFLRLVNVDREVVRGSVLSIGVSSIAADGGLAEPVDWIVDMRTETPRVNRVGQGQSAVRNVGLITTAGDSLRRQRPLTRWTPEEQRARPGSSDDSGCDMTPTYAPDSTEDWP